MPDAITASEVYYSSRVSQLLHQKRRIEAAQVSSTPHLYA